MASSWVMGGAPALRCAAASIAALCMVLLHTVSAQSDPLGDPQWALQHIEEFACGATPALIGPGWDYQQGTGEAYDLPYGWGNNELQYYTNKISNSAIKQAAGARDGCAYTVTVLKEELGSANYTSARVRADPASPFGSLMPYDGSDGNLGPGIRIGARVQLPTGAASGLWAAIWLLPTSVGVDKYGGWPGSGELDIMEAVKTMETSFSTIHFGGAVSPEPSGGWYVNGGAPPGQQTGQTGACRGADRAKVACNGGWHEWAVQWWREGLVFTIDGEQVLQIPSSQYYSCVPNLYAWPQCVKSTDAGAPFNTPFSMLINIAVGGNLPGPPPNTSTFPQSMQVDYLTVHRQVGTWRPVGFATSSAARLTAEGARAAVAFVALVATLLCLT